MEKKNCFSRRQKVTERVLPVAGDGGQRRTQIFSSNVYSTAFISTFIFLLSLNIKPIFLFGQPSPKKRKQFLSLNPPFSSKKLRHLYESIRRLFASSDRCSPFSSPSALVCFSPFSDHRR